MHLSIKHYPIAIQQTNQSVPATTGSKQCRGKRQRGYTLVELMVTCSIIGVLAAVAIPSYSDYVKKARLAEPQVLFSGIKIALETYYQEKDRFPDEGEFYQLELVTTGSNVLEIQYHADPMNPTIEMFIAGFPDMENTMAWRWKISGGERGNWWSCKPSENSGRTTIQFKYLPAHCRD